VSVFFVGPREHMSQLYVGVQVVHAI